MIEQCLSNKNENVIVSKSKNFLDLNKALLDDAYEPLLSLGPLRATSMYMDQVVYIHEAYISSP